MSEAQSVATEAPAAPTNHGHIPAGIEAALADIMPGDAPARAAPTVAGQPGAAAATAAALDALSEELFGEGVKWTPELLRERATQVREAAAEARAMRIKAHNARAEAERREAKFRATKESVLTEKKSVQAQLNLIQADLVALQSGDAEQFIQAIGRLSKAPDAIEFWKKAAVAVAQGRPVGEGEKIPEAVKKQLDELKATIEADKEAKQQAAHESQMWELRRQQVHFAQDSEAHPYVSSLAKNNPAGIDEALIKIRTDHYAATGASLDVKSACDRLETELHAHFEMLQQAGVPNGVANGERGAAPPVGGQAGKPEPAVAKPESAQSSPPNPQRPQTIPVTLSAGTGATRRPVTQQERREAIIAELGPLLDNIVG